MEKSCVDVPATAQMRSQLAISTSQHSYQEVFKLFQPLAFQMFQLMPSRAEISCPGPALPKLHIREQKSLSLGADCYKAKDNLKIINFSNWSSSHHSI